MNDPYEVLGLTPDAGETEIRQRYLELVRAFPPDQAPERFAAIHAAYESAARPGRAAASAALHGSRPRTTRSRRSRPICARRLRDVRLPVDTLLALADSP